MYTTSDDLIRDVLVKCFWHETDGYAPLSHARIRQVADQVISGEVWPEVVLSQSDHYTHSTDYTLATTTTRYRLPKNLYGPVRMVTYVDGTDEVEIPFMDLSDLGNPSRLASSPVGFHVFFDGDFLGVYPATSATGTMRVYYFKHPSRLCALSAATTIASMTLASDQLVLTANSGSWTTSSYLDVISQGNAHQVMLDYGDVSGVSSLTFTFSDDLASFKGQVGDFVATTGQTPIVQVPDHYIPAVASYVAAACLRADRDRDGAEQMAREGRDLMAKAQSLLIPRAKTASKAIVTRNSPMRAARGW